MNEDIVKNKVLAVFYKKGWVGLRKFRKFLKSLKNNQKNNHIISRVDFKYFSSSFGIIFNDTEVDYIFKKFDHHNKSEMDFNEFLDDLQCKKDHRKELILRFFS